MDLLERFRVRLGLLRLRVGRKKIHLTGEVRHFIMGAGLAQTQKSPQPFDWGLKTCLGLFLSEHRLRVGGVDPPSGLDLALWITFSTMSRATGIGLSLELPHSSCMSLVYNRYQVGGESVLGCTFSRPSDKIPAFCAPIQLHSLGPQPLGF